MVIAFTIVFSLLVGALVLCATLAFKSGKGIGNSVGILCISLIPPLIGNLIIIWSISKTVSLVGCYIYYVGIVIVMAALLRFTNEYCKIDFPKPIFFLIHFLMLLDVVQLLLNPFLGHAFTNEVIQLSNGTNYYRVVPYFGQNAHRVLIYGIFAICVGLFIYKALKSERFSVERYIVILLVMVLTGIWETFYIVSRTPMDRSMIGFGVFGLLVYYFAIKYRPIFLLDRMLANIASTMPNALFFYDNNNTCIWANTKGIDLVNIEDENFADATKLLNDRFGDFRKDGDEWSSSYVSGDGDNLESYVIEKHSICDNKKKIIGYFLSIRDNSNERKILDKEKYNAIHDSLTDTYNRLGYDEILKNINIQSTMMVIVDVDSFKKINDSYGHEIGDKILVKMVSIMKRYFRDDDKICRIGGDEFVVLIDTDDDKDWEVINERIKLINDELSNVSDGLPYASVSAGGAHGKGLSLVSKLFENADKALYDTKHHGKRDFSMYSD